MIHARYPLTAQYETKRRVVRSRNTTRTAVLGDETGNTYSDRLGYYFARPVMSADENGNALLGPTFYLRANPAAGIMPRPGYKVFYKKDDRDQYVIVGADLNDLEQKKVDARAIEPNDPYRAFRNLFEIVNLKSEGISSGLKVNCYPWQYQTSDNTVHFFEGTSASTHVDLADNDFIGPSAVTAGRTSILPTVANTRRFALLVFNITKHLADDYPLEVYPGVAQTIAPDDPLTINDDLQTCYDVLPTDEIVIPIKAYYLEHGQDEIAGISKDIDVRQFINVPSLSGGAIVLTSPEGTIDIATYAIDVADGAIDTSKLADDAVNGDKLASGSVDSIHIIDGAVGEAEIATDAVTPSKIPDSSIPLYKHAPGAPSIGGYGGGVIGYDGNGNASEIPNAVDLPVIWGENVADGDFAYLKSDDKWWKADADAGLISSMRGVVIAASGTTVANNPGVVRVYGRVDGFSGLTNGEPMYLSNTPGGYTQTEPTPSLDGSTVMIARYGHALSADAMFVDTRDPILYRTYVTSSADEETSVTHHENVPTQSRTFSARTYVYDETSIESYASSNQNADKQLKGQSGAGGLVTVDSAGASLAALGNNGSANFILAQSISATAGFVSQATVSFGANTGSPVGTVTASLHLDDGTGKPAALALESVVFTPTASSNNTITFAGTTFVSGTIWLKLAPNTTQASTVRWNVNYSNTNPYASGVLKADSSATPGTWATFGTTQDMRCSITTTAVIGYDRLAQGFSHSSSANVLSVKLWLRKVGSATGNLTLSIFSNNSGVPNTVITNGTSSAVDASTLGTSYAWVTFTFPVSPAISASTQYHLVLSNSASASNTNYVEWGIDTSSPGYANGVLTSDTGGTWSTASPAADGIFDVIAQGTQHEEDLQPGQWSGGVGQYGVRRGDSSGANKNTITRFKNISSDSMPIVYDVSVP